MTVSEAIKYVKSFTLCDEVDIIITDGEGNDHRLVNISNATKDFMTWVTTACFDNVYVSDEEEAVCIETRYNKNQLAYLLDGAVPTYYPEYTDDYFIDLADIGRKPIEEKLSLIGV